jgi:hypothetical protein
MIGGLWKSTSTAALFAAAGLFVGGVAMPSAKAADLGGDCCADLEERVAELEATTARKGNRRMSLTVSGQVSRSIIYWNDGDSSDVYAGVENHNVSTRFGFSGSARISPNLIAGFEILVEIPSGARSSTINQDNVDGTVSGQANLTAEGDSVLLVRTANWYFEDKNLGRLTVGRLDFRGPVATIDLGGINSVAGNSPGLVGGGFFVGGTTLANLVGPSYGGDRIEGIRWDSPSIGGFVAQATWGEDDVWSASLRYAGEFGGFRVAAGIGYQEQDVGACTTFCGLDSTTFENRGETEWAGSLAIMHVASGLFAQGHYAESEFFNGNDANIFLIQAGITKNWFGLGNTSFYGEYAKAEGYLGGVPGNVVNVEDSDVKFYGVGVVQQIDAAAMEVFLGWRRFEIDTTVAGPTDPDTLDLIHGGARVRF